MLRSHLLLLAAIVSTVAACTAGPPSSGTSGAPVTRETTTAVPASAASGACLRHAQMRPVPLPAQEVWKQSPGFAQGAATISVDRADTCPRALPSPAQACGAPFPFAGDDPQQSSLAGLDVLVAHEGPHGSVVQGMARGGPPTSTAQVVLHEVRYVTGHDALPEWIHSYLKRCATSTQLGGAAGWSTSVPGDEQTTVRGFLHETPQGWMWLELDGAPWPPSEQDRVVRIALSKLAV